MSKVSSIVVACVGTALAASLGFASKGHLSPINTTDTSAGYTRVTFDTYGTDRVSFNSANGECCTSELKTFTDIVPDTHTETPPTNPDSEDPNPDDHNEKPEEEEEVQEEEQIEESTVTKVDQAQSVLGVIAVVAILGIAGLLAVMFFRGSKKKVAAKK